MKSKFYCEKCDNQWTTARTQVLVYYKIVKIDKAQKIADLDICVQVFKTECMHCENVGQLEMYLEEIKRVSVEFGTFLEEKLTGKKVAKFNRGQH